MRRPDGNAPSRLHCAGPLEDQGASAVDEQAALESEARWEDEDSAEPRVSTHKVGSEAGSEVSRNVLVVGDESLVRMGLIRALRHPEIKVFEAGDANDALACLRGRDIDLVIADHGLPATSGIELLERVRHFWPSVRRVLISDARDFALMRAAINRAGVEYFLSKPWESEGVHEVIHNLVRSRAAAAARPIESLASQAKADGQNPFADIVGESRAIQEPIEMVARVAATDSTVLITGETGTGKELFGRALHFASERRSHVFCAVNSAAFPEPLLESELFGHRRGAFTGASANKKGLLEHAHRGTVFLDEIGEMSLSMQPKILRFLQSREIRPVGGETVRCVDVRLVVATNKDLEGEVAAGRFREDLYYRLAVIPVRLPPLRERVSDIPLLARHFLRRISERTAKSVDGIEREAMNLLLSHSWPGNVRELENTIERAVALCTSTAITAADLCHHVRNGMVQESDEPTESLHRLERRHILETLEKVGWNRKHAAQLLQISTTTLWRRLKEFGIQTNGSRSGAQNHLLHPES